MTDVHDQAREAFRDHILTRSDEDRWLIQRPQSSTFLAEVISVRGGLVVCGDIDACVFMHSNSSPVHKLLWMGAKPRVCSYVAEKAQIGLGGQDLVWKWEYEKALEDLYELCFPEGREHLRDQEAKYQELYEHMTSYVYAGAGVFFHELAHDTHGLIDYDDFPSNFGCVLTCRVVYAHAAIRRLCELLEILPEHEK